MLRDWLQKVEELGELHRIKSEIDWNEEMAALTYMVASREGAPALLFEKVKDYPEGFRVLFNLFGTSRDRLALALSLPTGLSLLELIQATREKLKRAIPPRIVPKEAAPVNENIIYGDDIDLYKFPAPKMWPLDGGRYLGTADIFITRDPDDGHLNVGTYRQMIRGKNELFVYWSPGKDARLQAERCWKRARPFEVAAAYGMDPELFIVGSQSFAKTASEYDYAGGIRGEPIEVTRGEVTDLLIPARAEIVLEGLMYPGKTGMEGPFGEFTGYYGRPEAETPIIDIKCIHYRNNPILTCALMADYPACEQVLLFAIARSARIWDDLDRLGVPGIKGVYAYPAAAGGFGMIIVSLEQRYAGHAQQVAALAAQCPGGAYYTKWIIVVDEDVDPTDINQVIWAMSTRCNPAEAIDILRNTWSTWLDPSQNPPEERPYGSKALIYACKEHKYIDRFSKRSKIRRALYDRLSQRWKELGMPGSPPRILAFEEETARPGANASKS